MNSAGTPSATIRYLLPIIIIAVGASIAFYFFKSRPQAEPNTLGEVARPVDVVVVESKTITPKIVNFGEVVASREAEIRAMVVGRLTYIAPEFKDGAVMRAGTVIAEIDRFEYELAVRKAQADLDESIARLQELRGDRNSEVQLLELANDQLALRQRDRDRSVNLLSKGQASRKARDDSEIALSTAKELTVQRQQSLQGLKSRIEQQNATNERAKASLSTAQRDLEDTKLIAPFDGFVASTNVALGKRFAEGESLGRLISETDLQVRFQLNNDEYARLISRGAADTLFSRRVRIGWRLGTRVFEFDGQLERRGAEIDPASGGVIVYASVAASTANESALRPGAFVEVTLDDIQYADVFELPLEAVLNNNTVFVVRDNRLQAAQVEIVRKLKGRAIVRAGVENGTQIVVTPFPEIGPGMLVRVVGQGA